MKENLELENDPEKLKAFVDCRLELLIFVRKLLKTYRPFVVSYATTHVGASAMFSAIDEEEALASIKIAVNDAKLIAKEAKGLFNLE